MEVAGPLGTPLHLGKSTHTCFDWMNIGARLLAYDTRAVIPGDYLEKSFNRGCSQNPARNRLQSRARHVAKWVTSILLNPPNSDRRSCRRGKGGLEQALAQGQARTLEWVAISFFNAGK